MRRSSFAYIYNLELDVAIDLIAYQLEQDIEDKLYFRWVIGYQDQMSYERFKDEITPAEKESEEETLKKVFDIIGGLNGNI